MNGYSPDTVGGNEWTPEGAASNIRRYLDVHQRGSRSATSVVAHLVIEKSEHEGDERRENGSARPGPRGGSEDRLSEQAQSGA